LDSLVFAGGVLNLDFSWSLVNYRPAPIYQIDMFFWVSFWLTSGEKTKPRLLVSSENRSGKFGLASSQL
ncbi:hypothetical protein OAG56_06170, partial [Mariniblastus sp.]